MTVNARLSMLASGTTPHGLPYPEGSDPPAGHLQIQALAAAVDALVGPLVGAVVPTVSRRRLTALTLAMNAWSAVPMEQTVTAETAADADAFTIGSTAVTVRTAGVYAITGTLSTNSTSGAALLLAVDAGAVALAYDTVTAPLGTGSVAATVRLAAGKSVDLRVYGYGPAGNHSVTQAQLRIARLGP